MTMKRASKIDEFIDARKKEVELKLFDIELSKEFVSSSYGFIAFHLGKRFDSVTPEFIRKFTILENLVFGFVKFAEDAESLNEIEGMLYGGKR